MPSEAVEIWEQAESYPKGELAKFSEEKSLSDSDSHKYKRDRVAKALGVGKEWLRDAKAVKDSGRKDLVEQMDEGAESYQDMQLR